MELKALNKAIDDLNHKASGLMDEYQRVGLLCLGHLKAHGDVGPANRLQVGMPKGARKLAMGVWLMKHGSLQVNMDKGTRDTMPMSFLKGKETDLVKAEATKWWDELPERNISDVFDLQVAVKRLIAQATRQGIKLKIGGEDKPHEAHSMLRMMAVGVGLANPFAAEEAAAAEVVAKAQAGADKAKKDGDVNPPIPPASNPADKPTVAQSEGRATAAAKQSGKPRGRRETAK